MCSHCPVRLNHDSWTSLDYDSRRGVHSISRETGERQTSLKYLLQEMGKPFDLVAIPKECPEGKSAEKTQTCVGKVDFLQSATFSLVIFDRFFSNSDQMLAEILSIFFYFFCVTKNKFHNLIYSHKWVPKERLWWGKAMYDWQKTASSMLLLRSASRLHLTHTCSN